MSFLIFLPAHEEAAGIECSEGFDSATIAVTGPSDALLAPQEEKETIRCEKLVTAAAAAEQNLARKIDAPNQLFWCGPGIPASGLR